MNFLYPAFLIGGLAIAVPIVLHFLRRDIAPIVEFSAVRLLRKSPVARSRRRRLRDLILLAARVAALLLLALAFARPYNAAATIVSPARIIAIDRSFSMDGPGRFARAIDLARRAVDEASTGERVAVIAFDDHAETVAPPGPAAVARTALSSLSPGFGATRYAPVLARAAEIAGADGGRLILISDLQRGGWEPEERGVLPAGLDLDVKDAGAAPDNIAVIALRPAADRVVVSIRNTGQHTRSGQIRVDRDGHTAATASYTAPAGEDVDAAIPYRTPSTGFISASVDDPGGLAADNTRYAVVQPVAAARVLVVTSGAPESGFYLVRALGAVNDDGNRQFDIRPVAAQKASAADLSDVSAVVLLSTRALDRLVREALVGLVRSGTGLFVAGSPDIEREVLSALFNWKSVPASSIESAGGALALSPVDVRHPVFRPFGSLTANLGQVRFERAWRLPTDGWDVSARFTDGNAAMVERREGTGRVVVFASDIDRRWNDFPTRAAFVPFAAEAVRYVAASRDRGLSYLIGSAPKGAGATPGIYRAASDGREIAVNVDPRESSPARLRADEFAGMIERVSANPGNAGHARSVQVEARQHYWEYGLLLMLAALVAESFAGRV
jgi:hypothetical protein